MTYTIEVARDFSRFPGGRYISDGRFSGEEFRDRLLVPALNSGQKVRVVLDDVAGLPASFLEEAFGGLVRMGYSEDEILDRIQFVSNSARTKRYPSMIVEFIHNAQPRIASAI